MSGDSAIGSWRRRSKVIESLACNDDELSHLSRAARELVEKLLSTLAADDRKLVRLIALEGYTYNQVRVLTGWNPSAMKVRMFRIRKRLEKPFADFLAKNLFIRAFSLKPCMTEKAMLCSA